MPENSMESIDEICDLIKTRVKLTGLHVWLILAAVAISVLLNLCLAILTTHLCLTNRRLNRSGVYKANPSSGRLVFDNCTRVSWMGEIPNCSR
ncbi:hypothetical protein BOX15_Mlig030764g2 [Macrostomum lignano]|uniref:Uncharacterized protein n=1 Tax=Macrostomum lignano TaxID=282301 RepID=A0A267DNP5_9PLAT|nr:hypothetical protein BOX15_Mlig030764g2 [Macrostomum lignano]